MSSISRTAAPPAAQQPAATVMAPLVNQAALFRQLRWRLIRNSFRVALETSKWKLITMISTSGLVALFVFMLSWYGFNQLFVEKVPVKGAIIAGLFDLMFFSLGMMLLVSTGVILYAALFTAPEARFLLATPARADRIFATKFQTAIAFSSWAFMILGIPILIAYGGAAGVPWYYYPLLPVFLLGFVFMPASVSAIVCMLLVRYIPRNRKQVIGWSIVVVVVLSIGWLVRFGMAAKESLQTGKKNEVEGLIGQFALTRNALMPSHWMTSGVTAAARGDLNEALLPLAMLWSQGLVLYLLAAWIASRLYRTAFDHVVGGGRRKRIYGASVLDRVMGWLVCYLDRPTRVLIIKDFRIFRRDPTQWALLILFGGLLLLGASNFRRYYQNDLARLDQYVVSLVNLGGTAVLLCAGLSRFIFPLMSLEGRKFWILGLMPIRREKILWGKFAFAATGSVLIASILTGVGDGLLGLPVEAIAAHMITAVAVAIGLCGLNVGLGAYMPNFRETDPSKIVVGFGGTVNMVIGLSYLMAVICLGAGPLHLAGLRNALGGSVSAPLPLWAFAGLPLVILLAVLAVWLPLRAGSRALKATEF